jgi:hypothetical protein
MGFVPVTITPRRLHDGSGLHYNLVTPGDTGQLWVRAGSYMSLADVDAAFVRPLRREIREKMLADLRAGKLHTFSLENAFEPLR